MSFETLKIAELRKVAEDFAVATDGLKSKADIIAALTEEGVTYSVYQKTMGITEEEKSVQTKESKADSKNEQSSDTVLVRMTRPNFRYDIMGHTFTKDHPFVAMTEKDAQAIFDKEEGFRLATPKEAQEFYG